MRSRLAAVVALLLAIGGGGVGYTLLRAPAGSLQYQGWVEADFVFVSPDESGRIEKLWVREGSAVTQGAPLFALDDDLQHAAVAEKEAAVANARKAYDRAKHLLNNAVGSQKTFDDAEAALRTAEARLNSARTQLERRKRASPVAGTVQEIYFREGEMVVAGRPIASLLPPGNIKVRFFVPQATLPSVRIGDRVEIRCDGCSSGLFGRVSFISAEAEFSPPVIYSLEERARLVFRVEALPERPDHVRIGQPASVTLLDKAIREAAHARE